MASMISTPRAVLDEEPSAAGPDDGAGARAAGPDDGAGGMVAGSMTAGGIWKEYTDWNSFTLDVHRYAAAQGKQVITDPLRRGSKSRHMRCTDYQEKLAGYELAVLAKYDGDVTEQAAHLQRTPFATVAHQYRACPFVVVANRSRKGKPIRVSALAPNGKSVLTHSEGCRSVVKVKPTTLMNDTNIKRVVLSSGKATGRQLEAAAQAAGLVTKTVALYAAQRQLKMVSEFMLGMRLDALPGFFAKILEANPGSIVHVQVNKDGVFERAFLMLDACVKAALRIGRKIAGSDFGHLQHSLFDGCEGAGCFKTGSGYEFPVWLMYATGNEDEDKWRYISTQILRHPQGAELYSDLTEFSDRSKGKKAGFDAQFPGMIPLDCAGHILENVRKVARLHKEHFSNSDFWQLQGSKNANVGACHIDNWKANYPHCCEYLLGIPAETWVWFQQVKNGGSTYRERTSNLAEHDQAVQSKKGMGMRGLDPLSYFAEGLKRMCNALSKEADRMEECKAAGVELVPHALEKMRANEALSTRRTASGGPNVYEVRAILATGVDSRVCNWETRECDCGKWQDEHLPCADAFAVGREKGLCAIEVMRHGAEKSYFVTDYLKDLQFQLAVPPTDDDLRLRFRAAEEEANGSSRIAAWLSKEPTRRQRTGDTNDIAALNYDAIISGGHGTGVGLPPPKKRAKSHGNSKYGRYKGGNKNDRAGRGSRGARTRGRTRAAASIASVTIGSERAHLLCKKCKAGGRVGPEYLGHRSGVCPFEQKVVLLSSSSSEDEDEDKKMAASHSGK